MMQFSSSFNSSVFFRCILICASAGALLPARLFAQANMETSTSDAATRGLDFWNSPEAKDLKKKADADAELRSIPTLYEGELEDSGPQLLLLPAPPHNWFQVLCDIQYYATSNAALTEHDTTAADVLALTAQAAINAKPFEFLGGKFSISGGFRFQNFWYGLLSGEDGTIHNSSVPVDSLNFQTYTPYVQFEWRSGDWFAGIGGRFSLYTNYESGKTTYQEWSPSAHAGRAFRITEKSRLMTDVDFAYRLSHTFLPEGVSLPESAFSPDQNDRYDIGLNLTYTLLLGENWIFQPAYRFQFSKYTHLSREDYYNILSFTVGYYFNEYFSVRAFISAEFRNSNDPFVSDYKNISGGIGMTGLLEF